MSGTVNADPTGIYSGEGSQRTREKFTLTFIKARVFSFLAENMELLRFPNEPMIVSGGIRGRDLERRR